MPSVLRRFSLRALVTTILGFIVFVLLTLLTSTPARADGPDPADEVLFYRDDGTFRFYDIRQNGTLPEPISSGTGFSTGWSSITGLDLDGRGQDELFFYRSTDGAYRFYHTKSNGTLGNLIEGGTGYSTGWSSITAVDLDGDGQDEIFFYRASDGAYRYYNINSFARLGSPILGGLGYSLGWTSITAVDVDGDGADEMFFYRSTDGAYRYYRMRPDGRLGALIRSGSDYSTGWSAITAIDIDGDRQDELFFYRSTDGAYRYYHVRPNATLGTPLLGGSGYSTGWTSINAVDIHGDMPMERISRFTTFFDCCQNRVTNIRTMARAIDGYVVMPGETFSIDEVVGPRTTAKGYLPAPYLQGGEGRCCAIGGGVSQFGTTIHNAVFWGGLEVISHKPHSGWISRYPLGIEATLVYSSIDYRFRNDTPNPLTIRTSTSGTSVTVELWGNQGGWRMVGYHPRGSRSSVITVHDAGGPEAKRVSGRVFGSAPGTVRIVRTLTQGGVARNQTWFWHYVS